MVHSRLSFVAAIAMGVAMLPACSGGGGGGTAASSNPAVLPMSASRTANATAVEPVSGAAAVSVLKSLDDQQTIGSVVDPVNGDVNPYGLDVAKVSSGKIHAGDLVICDFNDEQNVQGTGDAIVAIHPVVGSKPVNVAGGPTLVGCNALVADPPIAGGPLWMAAFSANDNPIYTSSGAYVTKLGAFHWHHPFGEAFAHAVDGHPAAFYVSNAGDGSLVRVSILPGPSFKFTTIVTGFPVNGGVPGSILGPSGLNYQPNGDRLYVVDGTMNTLYAIDHISEITANGITVHGTAFSGAFSADAHAIFHGAPLNGPISSAILFNGNIVLGNTLDPNGKNLMVEISPTGSLLDVKNVDTGAAGSLFGMVATGSTLATTKLYFNDDNANTLEVLSP